MSYDIGDVVAAPELEWFTTDPWGNTADVGTATVTVTAPDGTTSAPTVTHAGLGHYTASFTAAQAGMHNVAWVATGTNAQAWSVSFDVRAAVVPIIPLDEAKAFLTISTTTSDDLLANFIDAVGAAVESYTGQTFRRQTFTEVYNADGDCIPLRHFPVISVTSMTVWGATVPSSGYILQPEQGLVYRSYGSAYLPGPYFPGVQQVTVTYVAGFTNIPDDVVHASKVLLKHLWETQRGSQGLLQRSTGQDEYGYRAMGYTFPMRVLELLDAYKAPSVG